MKISTTSVIINCFIITTPPIAGILSQPDPLMVYLLAIGLISLSIIASYLFLSHKPRPVTVQIEQNASSAPVSE